MSIDNEDDLPGDNSKRKMVRNKLYIKSTEEATTDMEQDLEVIRMDEWKISGKVWQDKRPDK